MDMGQIEQRVAETSGLQEAACGENAELGAILRNYDFFGLVSDSYEAMESDDQADVVRKRDRLGDLLARLDSFAREEGVPFYLHDLIRRMGLDRTEFNQIPAVEEVLNKIGALVIVLHSALWQRFCELQQRGEVL